MSGPTARLVLLFSRAERSFYLLGTASWLAAIVYFWSWWLRPENVSWWPGYIALTLVFAWIMLVS
jgi:cellulose synthase (UDP-forming)